MHDLANIVSDENTSQSFYHRTEQSKNKCVPQISDLDKTVFRFIFSSLKLYLLACMFYFGSVQCVLNSFHSTEEENICDLFHKQIP